MRRDQLSGSTNLPSTRPLLRLPSVPPHDPRIDAVTGRSEDRYDERFTRQEKVPVGASVSSPRAAILSDLQNDASVHPVVVADQDASCRIELQPAKQSTP